MSFAPVKFDDNGRPYHGNDKNLFVEFFTIKELLKNAPVDPLDPTQGYIEVTIKTDDKGQCIYKETPFIRIITPGSKTTVVEREVRMQGDFNSPSDPERFPYQWERYKKGEEQKQNGHLLSEMGLGEKEIRAFNEYNIYTVEHLINVPDGHLQDITLGARSIRESAKVWLDHKKNDDSRLKKQEDRITELEAQILELLKSKKGEK